MFLCLTHRFEVRPWMSYCVHRELWDMYLINAIISVKPCYSRNKFLRRRRCHIFWIRNTGIHHHDDVIKWKHFPRYWPFVRGIHRSPVNSPHKGQWRGALMFSLICVWINGWVNNREAGDWRRYRAHYDATAMINAVCVHDNSPDKCWVYVLSECQCFILLFIRVPAY